MLSYYDQFKTPYCSIPFIRCTVPLLVNLPLYTRGVKLVCTLGPGSSLKSGSVGSCLFEAARRNTRFGTTSFKRDQRLWSANVLYCTLNCIKLQLFWLFCSIDCSTVLIVLLCWMSYSVNCVIVFITLLCWFYHYCVDSIAVSFTAVLTILLWSLYHSVDCTTMIVVPP